MHPIYHITHIKNLPGIVREGGIVCDKDAGERSLCAQNIGHSHIKERRMRTPVESLFSGPIAEGGYVSDYVPFYFCIRAPMLFAISKGAVEGFSGRERDVVYLVSSVETVTNFECSWCFTDGHAVEEMTEFFDDLGALDRINWKSINAKYWSGPDLLSNPDLKRQKQAEFLVHRKFPWCLINKIVAFDSGMLQEVDKALANAEHRPTIAVERTWYYAT